MANNSGMEALKKYLEGQTQADFAKSIGISPPYLNQILSGSRTPSLRILLKISEVTKGRVPLSAWDQEKRGAA